MRFLGHLDLMRYFQKALRRADFPLEFSKGFHPHPIMSFAQPLSVGVSSSGEYFDLSLSRDIDIISSKEVLNNCLSSGINVINIEVLPDKSKNVMSLVSSAKYLVYYKNSSNIPGRDILEKLIKNFLEKPEIIYTKKTKKSEITKDIRPFIYSLSLQDIACDNPYFLPSGYGFNIFIKAGSEFNLTPLPVIELMYENSLPFNPADFGTHRLEIVLKD